MDIPAFFDTLSEVVYNSPFLTPALIALQILALIINYRSVGKVFFKWVWALLIILLPPFGALLYFIFGTKRRDNYKLAR